MGWTPLLFCAVVVLCPVLADDSELNKSHGNPDFSQISSIHQSASDSLHHFLHSPYASQFTKFEQLDGKDKDVHHNVKTIIVTKKVPVPYTVQVERKVPYAVKVPVRRPYAIYVPKPYLVEIPKPVPYAVKVPIPQPYTVERHVPVPYRVPIDKPFPVQVPKPYPVIVERKVPVAVEKPVPFQVKVPIEKPVPVPVPVEKHIPFTVEKPVPVPVHLPEEKPFNFNLNHHHGGFGFPGHLDASPEHAQLAPYYAEYFQKHFNGQTQTAAETQNKGFSPSPEKPNFPNTHPEQTTISTVESNQQSKVLSFVPGSTPQEHVTYYYTNPTAHNDVLTANSNNQVHKVPTTPTVEFQWPKPLTGDWTPNKPTSFMTSPAQKPTPAAVYSLGDGKTVFKFSLDKNPESLTHVTHNMLSESVKSKPLHHNIFYNHYFDTVPTKNDKNNLNKKKNTQPGSEGIKPVYFDMSKQKPSFVNFEVPNTQITADGHTYAFLNPTPEKYEFLKPQSVTNNFNIPKTETQQVNVEHFDFSNAQPLIQVQNPTQSPPYFQSLQQLHSYSPLQQNFSAAFQYAYPYQKLNTNSFSLTQYPNVYSHKHTGYAYMLPDSTKHLTSKNKDNEDQQGGNDINTSYRFENSIKMPAKQQEEESEVITYPSVIFVSSENPDISFHNQMTTPKALVYNLSPNGPSLLQENSQNSQHTTSHPVNEIYPSIQIQAVQNTDPSNDFTPNNRGPHSPLHEIVTTTTRLSTRADSIFGSVTPPTVEKAKERRKDKRRSHSKHHRRPSSHDHSSSRVVTTTAEPNIHYTTESIVTQPSIAISKPQVPDPLDQQTIQTTSPQPEQYSRVEITKTFGHNLPIRMAYSINADNSHRRTHDWKRREEKKKKAEHKIDKETKHKESIRRRIRKPENNTELHTEIPATVSTSTISHNVRTRGSRRPQRQKSETTTIPNLGENSTLPKIDEISFGADIMRVHTSSKVHHLSSKLDPDSTPATSFTGITRSFPKKRRRNIKRHQSQENSTTTTSSNYPIYVTKASTPDSYSTPSSTTDYPLNNYNATANYVSTITYNSPNITSPNYPSTSNYPQTNQPTPFQMTPSFTTTSLLISSPNESPQTISQEMISLNTVK